MKRHVIGMAVMAAVVSSCSKDNGELTTDNGKKGQVMFRCQAMDVELMPYTRATLADGAVTNLYIFEGSTLVAHQVSTDANFGSPTVSLDYGSHDLTFVASKADGQSFANSKWTCTGVKDTFVKTLTLTVSKGMDAQDVELARANAKVQWTIEDAIPATAKTVTISVGSYYSLTAALAGADAFTSTRTVDVTSYQGQKDVQLSSNVLTAVYGTEGNTGASITFKDASGGTIVTYSKEVPVLSNRVTNIHGEFFGTSGIGSISIASTDWLTQKDVEL